MKRVRLTVPDEDEAVIAWLDSQRNVSLSLRELIKDHLNSFGCKDYFDTDIQEILPGKKRGRPRKRSITENQYGAVAHAVLIALSQVGLIPNLEDQDEESLEIQEKQQQEPKIETTPAPNPTTTIEKSQQSSQDAILAMQGLLDK